MSSGTFFWILLLVAGPLLMVFMHRGHGGHGTPGEHGGHGSRRDGSEDSSGHAGPRSGQGASDQDSGGHRHRGC